MAQSLFSAQYLASSRLARRAVRPFAASFSSSGSLLGLLGDLGAELGDLPDRPAQDAAVVGAEEGERAENDGGEDERAGDDRDLPAVFPDEIDGPAHAVDHAVFLKVMSFRSLHVSLPVREWTVIFSI